MNPLLPPEFLIPLLLLAGIGIVAGSRRGARALGRPLHLLTLLLRLLTLAAMGVLALNPGRFVTPRSSREAIAWILLDRSRSMAVEDRFEEALDLTSTVESDPDLTLNLVPFADTPGAPVDPEDLADLSADGGGTALGAALASVLDAAHADPRPCRGILVLSDGVSTAPEDTEASLHELGLTARAGRIPVSARIIGRPPRTPDLSLELSRDLFTVTAGADRPVIGRVRSRGLPPVRTALRLLETDGTVMDETVLDLEPDRETGFELRTGERAAGLHELKLELVPVEGESRTDNNRSALYVHAVEVSLNVLLLEGVPHWDSKFLSQWLRSRRGIRLTTLHRLADNRWFRVDPDGGAPESRDGQGLLPGEDRDFREFDVILVGRGLDALATSRTTTALHRFVRDHGGMIIFTRGRPVTAPHSGIESMIPVRWLGESSDDHLARPAPAGVRGGLFGDLLPGPDDPLWNDLPALRGLERVRITDGLSLTLMEGALGPDDADPWPLLLSRRLGHGRVLLLNGEGMWHWDFRPGSGLEEKWYGHFWTQLLLWVMRNSRFQPGMAYSVEWTPQPAALDQTVEFRVRHRLDEPVASDVRIHLTPRSGAPVSLQPRTGADGSATARWRPSGPGLFGVAVGSGSPDPLRYLQIPPAPGESDDPGPDPALLRAIADASGGRLMEGNGLHDVFRPEDDPAAAPETEAVWRPHWTRAWCLLLLVALPAGDWAIRRRRGLL